VEAGVAPITIGLILSTGYLLARGADRSWPATAITVLTAVFVLSTRVNPLWLFALGGLLGLLRVV